jgi:phosphate transport system substrate-binding protein
MFLKTLKTLIAGAILLLSANGYALAGTEMKISGGLSIPTGIITPNKAAIEQETGLTLNVIVNNDGNGLMDLSTGKSDVAMIGAPMQLTVDSLNKAKPGSINTAGFEAVPVGTSSMKFIVNPANPVKSLTQAQLTDIFTGKITSWKDVGGPDQPIMVVSGGPTLGARVIVVGQIFGGADITDKARVVPALIQIAQVVAQAPMAIGYGNESSITSAVAVIPGTESKQILSLVTKGPPTPDMKKFIDAVVKYGAMKK